MSLSKKSQKRAKQLEKKRMLQKSRNPNMTSEHKSVKKKQKSEPALT